LYFVGCLAFIAYRDKKLSGMHAFSCAASATDRTLKVA
jgi:hypothetical protein